MMWWGNAGWGAGSWVAMSLMMLAGLGAVGLFAVWMVRQARTAPGALRPPARSARAERELAERFARGEMDEEQFTRARTVLHTAEKPPEPPS